MHSSSSQALNYYYSILRILWEADEVLGDCMLLTWCQSCPGPRPQTHGKLGTPIP